MGWRIRTWSKIKRSRKANHWEDQGPCQGSAWGPRPCPWRSYPGRRCCTRRRRPQHKPGSRVSRTSWDKLIINVYSSCLGSFKFIKMFCKKGLTSIDFCIRNVLDQGWRPASNSGGMRKPYNVGPGHWRLVTTGWGLETREHNINTLSPNITPPRQLVVTMENKIEIQHFFWFSLSLI